MNTYNAGILANKAMTPFLYSHNYWIVLPGESKFASLILTC